MQFDDPELAALAAFVTRYGNARWHLWRNNGLFYAWLLLSSPPVVLRDRVRAGVEERIAEFERVYEETRSPGQALAAAEQLKT